MPNPVLITGCSSGIGLATARHLAERGVPVYATVRNDADRERVGAISNVEAFVCDVTSDAHVSALRTAVDERGRGLWGIVHNAGIAHLGHLTVTPLEDMKQVFEVNVFGIHRVTNAFIDLVRASKGRVVTISSIYGTLSSALGGVYSMSKHAVEAYTDALAAQLGTEGVHVASVAPGNYASAIAQNALARFAPPSDASDAVRELFDNPEAADRREYEPPTDVVAACHAALFDETPRHRYFVVPNEDEADRTLETAAAKWARLNASTSYAWSLERLVETIENLSGTQRQ